MDEPPAVVMDAAQFAEYVPMDGLVQPAAMGEQLKRERPDDDEGLEGPEAKRLHVEPAANGALDAQQAEHAAEAGAAADGEQQAPQQQPADGEQEVKAEDDTGAAHDGAAAGDATAPQAQAAAAQQERRGLEVGSFKLAADAILKQDIPLPRRMASCVIGIKGQSVSKLRRESGAKIHVRPAAARDELDQVVEVEGNIDSVATCVRLIDDLLRSEDPAFKMHPKPIVTSRFLVLPEMIGPAIIGKGGTHAKHIKERTSVRIEVVPATVANQARQEIVLHGPPDRVRDAYHLLLGNIRKYGPTNLPAGAVPNPMPLRSGAGRDAPPPWRSGRDSYSPGAHGPGPYDGGGRGPPPPPPPRGGAPPPYRYDPYGPPPAAAYPPADPYRAPAAAAAAAPTAPYAVPAAPAAAPAAAAPAATYQAADTTGAAAAAAGGQQMMYILQDGVLKPLTVMYQQGAAAPAAAATVAPTAYAAAPAATYGTAAAPSSTGATTTATLYQQAATTAGTAQYTYALPAGTDATGAAAAWTVQQVGGQQVAATSAPTTATYTTAAGYGVQPTTQYAAAPGATQYYYQPQ